MKKKSRGVLRNAGPAQTGEVLQLALQTAKARGIAYLVLASTRGATAQKALKLIQNQELKLIVVTHNTGFSEPGEQPFDATIRRQIEAAGGKVLTGTMALRNVSAAIRAKFQYSETELINATLRMFGQGVKVVVEIVAMACDAGLIPPEDVVAVAGTSRGADTAAIVTANSSNRFFEIKIKEIIVKPSEF
jgi:hypothetical protein